MHFRTVDTPSDSNVECTNSIIIEKQQKVEEEHGVMVVCLGSVGLTF